MEDVTSVVSSSSAFSSPTVRFSSHSNHVAILLLFFQHHIRARIETVTWDQGHDHCSTRSDPSVQHREEE